MLSTDSLSVCFPQDQHQPDTVFTVTGELWQGGIEGLPDTAPV